MQHSNQTREPSEIGLPNISVSYLVGRLNETKSDATNAYYDFWNEEENQWVSDPNNATPFLLPENAEAVASRVGGMLIT